MTEKVKKITANDLSLMVGIPCLIHNGVKLIDKLQYISGVDIKSNKVLVDKKLYNPELVKPILKDLELLTIEDTVFISCDIMGYNTGTIKEQKKWNQNDLNQIKEYGFIQFDTSDSIHMPKVIEYLIRQGFNLNLLPESTYLVCDKDGRLDGPLTWPEVSDAVLIKKQK